MMKKSISFISIFFIIIIGAIYSYRSSSKNDDSLVSPIINAGWGTNISPTAIPSQGLSGSGEYNVLLLGKGNPEHEGGVLTDSIMVIHLNTRRKTASLIFIPRDIWISLP